MVQNRTIGFGIVGVGMIARFHVEAIRQVAGASVVAVAGRSPGRTAAFAREHGIPQWTTEARELAQRADIDVVCIVTPSGAHLDPALTAISCGKHVVVEKPLEITLERVDALLAAAKAAGVHVCPIFQARFGDGARAVKGAIDAGRLGRLVLASAYVKWRREASYYQNTWKGSLKLDGGGAVMNQGIHAVDLLQWFAGMPTAVTGFTTRRVHLQIEGEDTATASLRFACGALGTIEATTAASPGWSRRIEVCGEAGSICLEDDAIVRWDVPAMAGGESGRPPDSNALGSGAAAPNAISVEGHRRQLADLCAALRGGRALAIEATEGRNAVAIVRALYDSAEQAKAIFL